MKAKEQKDKSLTDFGKEKVWIDGKCYVLSEEEFIIYNSRLQAEMKVQARNVYHKNRKKPPEDIENELLNMDDIV